MPYLFTSLVQTDSSSSVVAVIFLVLGVVVYFLPWIVASYRKHPNKEAIKALIVFLVGRLWLGSWLSHGPVTILKESSRD
jgi:hypothetical protein